MAILYNKANVFYLIAGSLAALILLASAVLVVVSDVPLAIILTLAILSAFVIGFSYKIITNHAKINALVKENKNLADIKQQLEDERAKLVDVEKKIQELKGLEDKIKHQEIEITNLTKKMQDQKIHAEEKVQELKRLEDITEHQRIELGNKEEKIQELKSIVNKHKVKMDQKQDRERERSNSLPSFSLSLLGSKKAFSSTHSLPQQ